METTERAIPITGHKPQDPGYSRLALLSSLARYHANRLFTILLPGISPELVEVETVQGTEQLGKDYSYTVRIASDRLLDSSGWLGEPVSLALSLEPQPWIVHGMIFAIEEVENPTALSCLQLTMRSPLARLELSRQQRVWRNLCAAQVAYRLLSELMPADTPVSLEVQNSYREQPMLVQGQESDLAFLHRILSREGLFLLLRQQASSVEVVITDSMQNSGRAGPELDYIPHSGQVRRSRRTIYSLRSWSSLQPRKVAVSGFDPHLPTQSQPAMASSSVPPIGPGAISSAGESVVERFGECGGGREAHEHLARVYQRAYDARSSGLEIDTEFCLAPGQLVHIKNHFDQPVNSAYIVSRVVHQGDQGAALHGGSATGKPTYSCRASLLPATREYADLPEAGPPASGLMVAELEGEGHKQAFLDGEGCYRARLALDQGDSPEGRASSPLRALQPYGGKGFGMHWPMLPRTKVAVAGLDGDIDRPVVLGALGNRSQPLPVNSANPEQHVLRTPAGHELVLDDREGAESLRLSAAARSGELLMESGSASGGAYLGLSSPRGGMQLESGGNLDVVCGGARHVQVAADCLSEVGGDLAVKAEQGDLNWSAGGDLRLTSERGDLSWRAENGSALIESGSSLSLHSGEEMLLKAAQGDVTFIAEQGNLAIDAQGDIELISSGEGEIALGSDFGIRLSSDGEVTVEGESIALEARKIVLQAPEIAHN